MRILITGSAGQLGKELKETQNAHYDVTYLSSNHLDITDRESVCSAFKEHKPSLVINAAAYTAVDKAENDVQQAFLVNEVGSKNLAIACDKYSAKLLHISTDFVFDGKKSTPYSPYDQTNPLSVYGASKLAGELAIQSILAERACIVRTAWVYSEFGNNFVKTMLKLMQEKEQLNIVSDQVGTPTWARGLAKMLWRIVEKYEITQSFATDNKDTESVIYHWSDAGVASWYDFAVAIQRIALSKGLIEKKIPIKPIPSSAYPMPARRPNFSVLDKSRVEDYLAIEAIYWYDALENMLDQYSVNLV